MADLDKHIDQIKSKVYNNSPAACEQLDVIVGAARALDRYSDGNQHIKPVAEDIVEVLWVAHGSPVEGSDWPVPEEPEPEPEPEARRTRR